MKLSEVEIYSDATNMAVMRHPSRNFPGVLIQGDSLHRLLSELAVVLAEKGTLSEEATAELEGIHEELSEKFESLHQGSSGAWIGASFPCWRLTIRCRVDVP